MNEEATKSVAVQKILTFLTQERARKPGQMDVTLPAGTPMADDPDVQGCIRFVHSFTGWILDFHKSDTGRIIVNFRSDQAEKFRRENGGT